MDAVEKNARDLYVTGFRATITEPDEEEESLTLPASASVSWGAAHWTGPLTECSLATMPLALRVAGNYLDLLHTIQEVHRIGKEDA